MGTAVLRAAVFSELVTGDVTVMRYNAKKRHIEDRHHNDGIHTFWHRQANSHHAPRSGLKMYP